MKIATTLMFCVSIRASIWLACGRLSETGDDLMSQPTLSRLCNPADLFHRR
jgi:hypothetical protein